MTVNPRHAPLADLEYMAGAGRNLALAVLDPLPVNPDRSLSDHAQRLGGAGHELRLAQDVREPEPPVPGVHRDLGNLVGELAPR